MNNIEFVLADINNNLARIADVLEESNLLISDLENLARIADALEESNLLIKDLGGK